MLQMLQGEGMRSPAYDSPAKVKDIRVFLQDVYQPVRSRHQDVCNVQRTDCNQIWNKHKNCP